MLSGRGKEFRKKEKEIKEEQDRRRTRKKDGGRKKKAREEGQSEQKGQNKKRKAKSSQDERANLDKVGLVLLVPGGNDTVGLSLEFDFLLVVKGHVPLGDARLPLTVLDQHEADLEREKGS